MTTEARLESLSKKHAALEAALHAEQIHPLPDTLRLKNLKLEKLRLRDEIEEIKRGAANSNTRH